MTLFPYLALTFSVVLLLALFEMRWAASRAATDRTSNVFTWVLMLSTQICLLPLVSLNPLAQRFALIDLSAWSLIPAILAYTLLMDFAEFGFHRAQHAIPFLWKMHSLHHSDTNMNATTAARHFWGDQFVKAVTIWPACALILKPSASVLLGYGLISLYHYFIHANLPVSFGRWSWLLNHPAYHRRHHSTEPEHFGSNYASLFPVFDWICGTYRRPEGFPATGLERQPRGLADLALWPLRS